MSKKDPTPDFLDSLANTLKAYKWVFYGAISGAFSRSATAPLERLKILNQVQHLSVNGTKYKGVFSALRKIWVEEGFLAYWKGNGTNVVRIMPSEAARFFSYDVFKKLLYGKEGQYATSPLVRVAAGALAGMTSTLATFPLDLVRSRLSIQTLENKYKGMFHCLLVTAKEEGLRGLYKGLGISMMGIAPYVAINFASYETIKQYLLQNYSDNKWAKAIANSGTTVGAIAGTVAVTLTYPSDVLRRRMMIQGMGGQEKQYAGILDAISQMWKKEGVPAFFRGLIPCYLKVVPSTALSWTTIELCRKLWGS